MKLRDHSQPCEHGLRGTGRGSHPVSEAGCPGGKLVELVPASFLFTNWMCHNCGTDHGSSSCDSPDFEGIQLYRIVEEAT